MSLDWTLIATHGGVLALAASAVIMGSLRYNPRLFLRHFPAAVRAAQPPLTSSEKAVGRIVGVALIVLFAGVPIWSASVAARHHALGRGDVLVHAFLVGMISNAVDWLVLDELWLGIGKPRWALPPGVTPADVPWNHQQHFRGFISGTVLFLIVGAMASVVVSGG